MASQAVVIALVNAAVIAGAAGCGTSITPSKSASQPSAATATGPAPLSTGLTRVPCELLSPSVAEAFAGDDAQRRLSLDSNPPLPVGDDACFYKGSTRSVYFSINTLPSDPSAPVNHFHVIDPHNEIPGLAYKAYWFGPGESLDVVKDGLLLNFKVSDIPVFPGAQINQDCKAEDIKLADLIVPEVG